MDTEEGAKQKNLAMAKKKFNMDPKKVRQQGYRDVWLQVAHSVPAGIFVSILYALQQSGLRIRMDPY
jgi:hypothetical protein